MILGVSFDAPDKNWDFAMKFDFEFQLLSDEDRSTGIAYGAATAADQKWAARTGVIIGPDGRIAYYSPKVSSKTFPQEALALIR